MRATFGYGKQNGIIKRSGLEKTTARINANHRFFDNKLIITEFFSTKLSPNKILHISTES